MRVEGLKNLEMELSETPVKTITSDVVLQETIAMLREGRRVVLPVKGNSMHPFIIGGIESVELVKPQSPLKVGDVVLAHANGTHYLIHRISDIDGNRLNLLGDGNLREEHCLMDDVVALAEFVVNRNGNRRYLYTKKRQRRARLWLKLLPIRRWLLAIYRRTLLKLNIHL